MNNGKKILSIDYCSTISIMDDSYTQNAAKGYISFAVDHRELDNIPAYPAQPFQENADNINTLTDSKIFFTSSILQTFQPSRILSVQ